MNDKPVVMPVLIEGEFKSLPRKVRTDSPSLPAGTIVWIETAPDHWMKAVVSGLEFAVLHVSKSRESR